VVTRQTANSLSSRNSSTRKTPKKENIHKDFRRRPAARTAQRTTRRFRVGNAGLSNLGQGSCGGECGSSDIATPDGAGRSGYSPRCGWCAPIDDPLRPLPRQTGSLGHTPAGVLGHAQPRAYAARVRILSAASTVVLSGLLGSSKPMNSGTFVTSVPWSGVSAMLKSPPSSYRYQHKENALGGALVSYPASMIRRTAEGRGGEFVVDKVDEGHVMVQPTV
jgi:hypothetical protein